MRENLIRYDLNFLNSTGKFYLKFFFVLYLSFYRKMEYFRNNILTVCFNNTFSLYEIIVIFLAEKLPIIILI